ncbi:hypothetical protein QQY66_40185 [Streptomyces sp. DG2A-72]|uniref:hypothetical protein n=1 Tax=Streptomyces sp. DG2A-72 TaxID=3051386 RepID=UPI00265BC3E8|nr:hypothetical protein [Streptomyces sp. DG2A-72]MDO0937648.1 hypothetical protein [Streptomyces sp. DG2A-72]
MSHNAEHAPHPPTGSANPATPRSPQTPRTESTDAPRERDTTTDRPGRPPGAELVPQGERDKFTLRLQQALNNFVDNPHKAVEEADGVFDDIATQFTNTLTERRRVLRASWQDQETDTQTEELRLALRQYREITERLLHMSAPTSQ